MAEPSVIANEALVLCTRYNNCIFPLLNSYFTREKFIALSCLLNFLYLCNNLSKVFYSTQKCLFNWITKESQQFIYGELVMLNSNNCNWKIISAGAVAEMPI